MEELENNENVCVIICNWNKKEFVLKCVESVLNSNYQNFDIVVVDNASTDESVNALKEKYNNIEIIENKKNLGGTGGFNTGIKYALKKNIYKYVWLLDNDVVVDVKALFMLVETFKFSNKAGVVGSVILKMDEPYLVQELGSFIDKKKFKVSHNFYNKRVNELPDNIVEVDYVSACSILVDINKINEIGIMDEAFFLYYDEAEWCNRFKKQGYQVYATPKSKIWHKGGTSDRKNNLPIYFQWRNRFYFFLKILRNNEKKKFIDFYFNELFTAIYTSRLMGKTNAYKTFIWILTDILKGIVGNPDRNRVLKKDSLAFGKYLQDFKKNINRKITKTIILCKNVEYIAPIKKIIKFLNPNQLLLVQTDKYGCSKLEKEIKEWEMSIITVKNINNELFTDSLVLVICDHILKDSNKFETDLEKLLQKNDKTICYLDIHSNFFVGYSKMKSERLTFKKYFKESTDIYRSVFDDFLK